MLFFSRRTNKSLVVEWHFSCCNTICITLTTCIQYLLVHSLEYLTASCIRHIDPPCHFPMGCSNKSRRLEASVALIQLSNPNLYAAFLDSLQLQRQQQLFWTCMIHTTSQQSIIHSTYSGVLQPISNAIQLCHHRQNNIPPTLSLYIFDTDIANDLQHAINGVLPVRKQINNVKISWSDTNDDIV